MDNERMYLEFVPITEIKPNPLNPRKDHTINSEVMQEIIKKRGWETAITCYKKESVYYILSGHRRWFAATQIGEEKIPVYVVPAPKTELEELERLSSSQGGKVDWTVYEWSRYIFDLWSNKQENWTYREIALITKKSERTVYESIKVFRYFNHHEIEKRLEDNTLTITILYKLSVWIEKLKKYHMDIVNELSEDLIRTNLLIKAEKKRLTSAQLRADKFIETAPKEVLKKFLRDSKMKYNDVYKLINQDIPVYADSRLSRDMKQLEKRQKELSYMGAENSEDALALYFLLDNLVEEISLKRNEIISYLENQ